MKRVSNWCLLLGFMVTVMTAGTTLASSNADYHDLKLKIAKHQALTQADVDLALQMNDDGQASFDMREVWRLFKEGGGAPTPRPRPPHSALDEYQVSETTYNWFDVSELGEEHLMADDSAVVLDLPFDFSFYDQTYNSISLGANGYFVLGGTSLLSNSSCLDPIPTDREPNNFVAMFWRDLNSNLGTQGHVYTYHDAANGRFVIQFQDVQHFPSESPETFQCFLFSNGNIIIQYNSISDASRVTVGIENQDGSEGILVCQENTGTCPENELAILINQPNGFPNPVNNLVGSVVGENVVLTWTDPTTDTNGNPLTTLTNIQVWLGMPDVGTQIGTVAPGVQTFSHVNAPDGNLYYYVRPYANPYTGGSRIVNVIVGDPSYIEDFEQTDGLWVSDNPNGWQWGAPTSGPGSAHEGNNCWGTVLDGIYENMACYNLTLNPELTVVSASATVEFWIWYATEPSFDGCHFKVSIDGGVTWELVEPIDGYPQPSVFSDPCIGVDVPSWAGITDDWQRVVLPIGQYIGEVPQYQLTFGSDGSVQYSGFYFDDMLIWGLAEPVWANVSGTVTLDGGVGNVTNAVVRANGLGSPNTHPAANGTYTLTDVLVGDREVWVELANYVTTSAEITLTEAGLTNINFNVERVPPPAPIGLTGTVNNTTGIVSLNWNDSPDPLVDGYYVYRRVYGDTDWIYSQTVTASQTTYQLLSVGLYEMAVAAFDDDASHPIVSEISDFLEVLYGEAPPAELIYNGDHDNTIALYWFEPGTPHAYEISYDNGENSMQWNGLGWSWGEVPAFGWMTSRFQGTGEVAVLKARVLFSDFATAGDPYQIGIFEDDGNGMPLFEPIMTFDGVHEEPFNRFLEFDVIPPLVFPDGVFHIGTRQLTSRNVGLGGDTETPFITNTFYSSFAGTQWDLFENWNMAIPMQRAVAVGEFGQEIVLTPSPVDIPIQQCISEWERIDRDTRANDPSLRTVNGFMVQPSQLHPFVSQMSIRDLLERGRTAVAPHAPIVTIPTNRQPSNTLDDVDYYIVYRDDVDIAHPEGEQYSDIGRPEGTTFQYHITAHYENGEESGPSLTANAQCNMEPMPPTNLMGVGEGDTGMRLTWTNPTMNRDNSALVDLTTIYIYRDGELAGTVPAGSLQYVDIPPDGAGTYIWTVKAADEVPNLSEASAGFFGAVGNPSYSNGFEFDDGMWVPVSGWERGIPTNTGAPAAHGGENCWATSLATDYPDGCCMQMDLDIGLAIAETDAALEFWAAWDCEQQFDGAHVEISVDGGDTWEILRPESPYTFEEAWESNECMPSEPIWCGYAHNWEYITIPLGDYVGEAPIFRFLFGSDGSITAAGFFIDDMIIWGLAEPVTAAVTGTVTLDGGAGNVQNVDVRADGLGTPLAHPAANGSYDLDGVLVGNRRIRGSLNGYNTAITPITVTEAGPNVANLTLVRVNPPAPTGLTGSVANATGVVTLNWDDSTDPLVDQYRLYRRMHPSTEWVLAQTTTTSNATDQLTLDGIWDYTVVAVDLNVSTPVVSAYSAPITVLFGSLPPTYLSANGNYDDKIVLNWLVPGNELGHQLAYDDSSAEGFITASPINGWLDMLAVRFTPPPANVIDYPIEVHAFAIYLEEDTEIENLMVCPTTESDEPDQWTPIMSWMGVSTENSPGWLMIDTEGELTLDTDEDFWVVLQLPEGEQGPGVGGDSSDPDGRSYWFSDNTWVWTVDTEWDYLMRVWVLGNSAALARGGDEYVLTSGDAVSAGANQLPRIVLNESAQPQDTKLSTNTKNASKSVKSSKRGEVSTTKSIQSGKSASAKSQQSKAVKTGKNAQTVSAITEIQNDLLVPVRIPELRIESRNPPPSSLDDIDYYVVYRNGTDVGHPTGTTFTDLNRVENTTHSYTVTAHYDDGTQSPAAGPVSRACNMAPAPPSNLQGAPVGTTQMNLTWSNPTTNADGTALVDHQFTRVYRDGNLIATVASNITTYLDTPPANDQLYSWTVRALDEIPNISEDSEPFATYVVPPWQEEDYDWQDISEIGDQIDIEDWSQIWIEIPFSFPYFGDEYTSAQLSSHGYLAFGESPWTTPWNEPISSTNAPNGMIAMFWSNLSTSTGQVYTWGNPDNDLFIVQFQNVTNWNSGGAVTFQMILDDEGGILFQYETVSGEETCTVGAENLDGTMGVQLCYNGDGLFCPADGTAFSLWRGPSGEIHGTVREFGTNLAIPNCEITLSGLPDVILTNANGYYLYPCEPGTYTLTMHKQGYCDLEFPGMVVVDGSSITRNGSMLWPNGQFTVTSINMLTAMGVNQQAEFEIRNPTAGCPFEYEITTDQTWLTASPDEGQVQPNAQTLITVTANIAGLTLGEYNAEITVDHNDESSPYTIPLTLIISQDADAPSLLPTAYEFHQNYPNPFNATTVFAFDLPVESRVELAIFNVMGQEVARPVMADYPAGRYKVPFTADMLPSGMYVARLTAGEFTGLQKIVLLK